MPEQEAQVTEAAPPAKKGNPLIFIIIGVVLLAIVGGGIAFMMMSKKAPEEEVLEEDAGAKKEMGTVYSFGEPIIVNLSNSNAERFLKVKLSLELDEEKTTESIDKQKPKIMDILISVLSSKTLDEVESLSGKDRIKQEIKDKINDVLPKGKVLSVFYEDFVIQ